MFNIRKVKYMSENKKITKLSDLTQTHAKLEPEDENGNIVPTRLDQLLSSKAGFGKYGTLELEDYENEINQMNTAELRTHAIQKGLVPNSNPEKCRKQLKAAFQKHVATYKKPHYVDENLNLNNKKRQAVLNVLKAVK